MTSAQLHLSRNEARWLAVIASGLDRRPFRRAVTPADLLEQIARLGAVQLDTISVVSRSHETTMWSRLGPYDVNHWQALYDAPQRITETLAHAAAIVPIGDLPLFRSGMVARGDQAWFGHPENRAVVERVIDHVRNHGAVNSRDFERPDGAPKAGPWEWYGAKPEREALAGLWTSGVTTLTRRDRGFGRTWDLTDRVLPEFWTADPIPDDDRDRIFVARALRALGVATVRWTADYYRTGGPFLVSMAKTKVILDEFTRNGTTIPAWVAGIDEPVWLDPALAERVDTLRAGTRRPVRTTFLSPFDNLIWNRDRMWQLWGMHYRLECYVPEPKRQYGYYTMPILYRGQLIGRIDPSFDRRRGILTVKALHLEGGVRWSDATAQAIAGALDEFAVFLGGPSASWCIQYAFPHAILPAVERNRVTP